MLTGNAVRVLERRYLARDENGELTEDPEGMFKRVAAAVAGADRPFLSEEEIENTYQQFYEMMSSLKFLPNSPTLMNAGRPLGQLSACFVLPVEDSMQDIFEAVKNAALIHKSGGGTGFSFSRLRPKGSTVKSTGGVASGPVSFMKVFNSATEAVKQGGTRRGANMGILRVDHPDIREFITCKQDNRDITNFNISIGVTEEFMEALRKKEKYSLYDPAGGQPERQEYSAEIFGMIVDSAWRNGEPGIVFLDRINRDNVVPGMGEIEATNPCIKGDSWVLTESGPLQVLDILGKKLSLALNGKFSWTNDAGFFCTGKKRVIRLTTDRGYELTLTRDHLVRKAACLSRFAIEEEWVRAGDLQPGDRIMLSNNRGITWKGKGNHAEGYLSGLLLAHGTLKKEGGIISVWGDDEEALSLVKAAGDAAHTLAHRCDFKGFQSTGRDRPGNRMRLSSLRDLASEYGIFAGHKKITSDIEKTSMEFYKGFLKGIFDTDGTVAGAGDKGISIRLWQNDLECLRTVQRMLHRMGIASSVYDVKPGHELVISNDNMFVFNQLIGFGSSKRTKRLAEALKGYKRALNRERFVASVTSLAEDGEYKVYDVQVPGVNAFDANGLYVHNCGEQPLLPYESCNLGSINLSTMLKKTGGGYEIDYEKLKDTVEKAIHFLDNVIDVNNYPLPEIEEMTKSTRKVGLGVMGWADILCRLSIPYNSREAVGLAEKVMSFVHDEAVKKSQELAERKGVFPCYDKSIYREKGIKVRNAATTTIAPTGTLSIIAGVSSGIEPLYALAYKRNVMDNDSLTEVNTVFLQAAQREGFYSEELMERIVKKGSVRGFGEIPEHIRRVFVTAHDIDPEYHVRMQAAFQNHTDNAVSKTVNLRHDATRDDVKAVYELAYSTGCKGVTVYRDGSRDMQVLSTGAKKRAVHPRPRPDITTGFTEKVKIGCGNLYITVNYDDKGICEVFANLGRGGGCPSQSEAASRLISIALRSGVDVKSIVEQLKGIRCAGTTGRGLKVTSCPDAIGRVVEKVAVLSGAESKADADERIPGGPACPECGKRVEHEGGCIICRHCGFSKCG